MDKYARQITLLNKEKQELLNNSTVAIVGIGALGTVAAELLARAGVNLLLIDRDVIEETNLQRQLLYTEKDVGKSKVEIAKKKLQEINSNITINTKAIHLNKNNLNILNDANLILDGTDNLQTRFLINNYCKKQNKPWVYAAAIKTQGYVMSIFPNGPCLNCFLKEVQLETCATAGVLNTITTSIAALQTTLAIKILIKEEVESKLYHQNIWQPIQKTINIIKNKDCLTCQGKYIHKEATKIIKFCGNNKWQILGKSQNLKKIAQKLEKLGNIELNNSTIHFKNITLFSDGRALIQANSKEAAETAYSKYIGN